MKKESIGPDNISVGTLLWYSGRTSLSSWSCPAVIRLVDEEKKLFYITSLDDMKEQSQKYSFYIDDHSPPSRLSMHTVDKETVHAFMQNKREECVHRIIDCQNKIKELETLRDEFDSTLDGLIA